MNGRKLAAFALSGVMAVGLTACGGNGEPNESPAGGSGGEAYLVGICQLAPHDALDAATRGFKAALVEAFGEDGVKFDEQNAGGEYNNCATIVDGFVSENVDLMLANATYSLQAAQSATADIPILGTAITNYGIALGLDSTEDKVLGGNISGTSDLAPLDQQAAMLQELFPDAENVGLLYCSAEPNSVFQVETIQGYLEEKGYTCAQYAFTDVNDLSSVTQTACDNSDVIYIPTDNTAAANTETIANVVIPAGVPVIAGESGICSGCGVATLSIDYYELGELTGQMAYDILVDGQNPGDMEIQPAPTFTKMYNESICQELGITPPEGYEAISAE